MGLDARVYFAKESLPPDIERMGAKRDPVTGEYYFESTPLGKTFPSDFSVAIDRRLGNVSAIAELRDEFQSISQETNSILYEKCLYSGTHGGDVIPYEDVDRLENEILHLQFKIRSEQRPLLREFLDAMADLTRVAKKEKNPIVFV